MSDPTPRRGMSPSTTLVLVVAAFVVPILIAWWMAFGRGDVEPAHLTNHGRFISPPLDIRNDPSTTSMEDIPLAPGEWAVIHFTRGACAAACADTAATLLTLKSLLGNAVTRVRVAVISDAPGPLPREVVAIVDPAARQRLSSVTAMNRSDPPSSGVVFLDWRGQVMLFFPDASRPADIKSDLKRLLRGSKIR
ncbi:MAG: hypothetical protein WD928_15875 [Gammaproteobacteria bacterium]